MFLHSRNSSGPFLVKAQTKGHAESAWRRKQKQRQRSAASASTRDELSFGSELGVPFTLTPSFFLPVCHDAIPHTTVARVPRLLIIRPLIPPLSNHILVAICVPPASFRCPLQRYPRSDAVACARPLARPHLRSPPSTPLLCEAAARCPTGAVASRACCPQGKELGRKEVFSPTIVDVNTHQVLEIMSFVSRNFLAFFLSQVVVGLMFAAIFTDWYSWTTNYTRKNAVSGSGIESISSTTQLNYTNIYFNGTGFRITSRTSAQAATNLVANTLYYNWEGENTGYSKVSPSSLNSFHFFSAAHSCAGQTVFLAVLCLLHHRPHRRLYSRSELASDFFLCHSQLLHQVLRHVIVALDIRHSCTRHLGFQHNCTSWFSWCDSRVQRRAQWQQLS